jgi:hypothetical protein
MVIGTFVRLDRLLVEEVVDVDLVRVVLLEELDRVFVLDDLVERVDVLDIVLLCVTVTGGTNMDVGGVGSVESAEDVKSVLVNDESVLSSTTNGGATFVDELLVDVSDNALLVDPSEVKVLVDELEVHVSEMLLSVEE